VTQLYRLSPVLLLLLDIGPIQTKNPYSSSEGKTTKQKEASVMLLPLLLPYQIAQHAVAEQAAHASTHCCQPAELGHSSISAAASTTEAKRNNCQSPPAQDTEACPRPKLPRQPEAWDAVHQHHIGGTAYHPVKGRTQCLKVECTARCAS
jgi:hypothetical protein